MTQDTDRNNRKELIGFVRSKTGDKSVKVVYEYKIPHPLYKKEIRRKTTVHVHDEKMILMSVIKLGSWQQDRLVSLKGGELPKFWKKPQLRKTK